MGSPPGPVFPSLTSGAHGAAGGEGSPPASTAHGSAGETVRPNTSAAHGSAGEGEPLVTSSAHGKAGDDGLLLALFEGAGSTAEGLLPTVPPTPRFASLTQGQTGEAGGGGCGGAIGDAAPVGSAADLPALLDLGDVADGVQTSAAHGSAGTPLAIADAPSATQGGTGGGSGQGMLEDRRPLLALPDVERSAGSDLFQVPPAPAVLTAEQMMQRQIAELQQQLAATAVAVQHMRAARDQAQMQAMEEHRIAVVMQDEARLAHVDAMASRHQATMASQEAQAATSRVGQAELQAAALQQAAQRESAQTQACVQQLQADEQQRKPVCALKRKRLLDLGSRWRAWSCRLGTLFRSCVLACSMSSRSMR